MLKTRLFIFFNNIVISVSFLRFVVFIGIKR